VAVAVVLTASSAAGQNRFTGPGILLPVQDRVGAPELAAEVYGTLESAFVERHQLVRSPRMREALRRLRIRDIMLAAPAQLDQLGQELGVEWFLSSTLHEAVVYPMPQITLSARLYRVGAAQLQWAGFEAGSGLDGRRWLGLGGTEDIYQLARLATQRLADSALGVEAGERPSRFGTSERGFLSPSLHTTPSTVAAVIPFDSVSDLEPAVAAEIITEAAVAALYRNGITLLSPSLVDDIQREQGRLLRGELDTPTRLALKRQAGVDWVLTGTVEAYVTERSVSPDPSVALSARLIDTSTGRIVWIDGQERRGARRGQFFDAGRIYSAGSLADEIVRSLVGAFANPNRSAKRTSEG
jgi:TolB-like protein